jgi:hypothetical protein
MIHPVRRWLAAAAIAGALVSATGTVCRGEAGDVALPGFEAIAGPSPLPSVTTGAELAPPLAKDLERPPAYVLPPAGWPKVDFVEPDPLLDRPYSAQPSWFANAETSVLWAHLRNQLSGPVLNPITGNTDRVAFPGNKLEPMVSPRIEVGYRLCDNWGALVFGYRGMASRGRDQVVTSVADTVQGAADQLGRFDANLFDFTYISREYSLDPNWNMRWGAGARSMFLYFDSRVTFQAPGTDPGSILAQAESNSLRAYGCWLFLDLERKTPCPGLYVFARIEGTELFARNQQFYRETLAGGPDGLPLEVRNRFNGSLSTETLREVVGLSYEVPQWNHSRFMLGYQYETFFEIGRQTPPSGIIDTRGQLDVHGLFLRAEINF